LKSESKHSNHDGVYKEQRLSGDTYPVEKTIKEAVRELLTAASEAKADIEKCKCGVRKQWRQFAFFLETEGFVVPIQFCPNCDPLPPPAPSA
jgi:hypothetical protein